MSLLKAYADMWKNCFNFSGYTNRKDFLYCYVVNFLISNLLRFVDNPYLVIIIAVICVIPVISLDVRRLRDGGRSWKWLLLVFTGIGAIVPSVMLLCCKSVEHEETEITSEEQKETEITSEEHEETEITSEGQKIDATSEKVRKNKKIIIGIGTVLIVGCVSLVAINQLNNRTKVIEIEMVHIPGQDFKMLKTEVTQELYESVMGENPSYFQTGSEAYKEDYEEEYIITEGEKEARLPVEQVSWYDAIYFCNKLSEKEGLTPVYSVNGITDVSKWGYTPHNEEELEGNIRQNLAANGYRLPTEEEWEYAAEGGQNYEYSGSNDLNEVGWYEDNSGDRTHSVAQKKANGYGLYDMSGNVWEWCWDVNFSNFRYIRGGSYYYGDRDCRVDGRYDDDAINQSDDRGFRVVCFASN